jgi:hypothetical protein
LFMLPKPFKCIKRPNGWRGIALLNVLFKLWEKAWLSQASLWIPSLSSSIIGFRKGRQCLDLSLGIRIVIQKAAEWNEPVFVGSLDLRKAFDYLQPLHVATILRKNQCPAPLVAAWLEQQLALRGSVVMAGAQSCETRFQSGCKQGSPATPAIFNWVLSTIMDNIDSKLGPEEWAVEWLPQLGRSGTFIWADNFFIVTSDYDKLQKRVSTLEQRLRKLGLLFGPDSLQYIHNEFVEPHVSPQLPIAKDFIVRVERLPILGTSTDCFGDSLVAFASRLRAAHSVFHKHHSILTDKTVELSERIAALYRTVGASLLFDCGGWLPCGALRTALERAEAYFLRRLIGRKRVEGESWVEAIKKGNSPWSAS